MKAVKKEPMEKKRKIAVSVSCLLLAWVPLLTVCLSLRWFDICEGNRRNIANGCVFPYGIVLESKESIFKRKLEEKYGEEFYVRKIWNPWPGPMKALCLPTGTSDPYMVFEAGFSRDGTVSYGDNYLERAVSRRIALDLEEDLKKYFRGCSVQAFEGYVNYSNYLSFGNPLQHTPKETYAERYPSDNFVVHIYVDTGLISDDTIEEEYRYFSETLYKQTELGEMPRTVVHIFLMDGRSVSDCRSYYWDNTERIESTSLLSGCDSLVFDYLSGPTNVTYEEYEKFRTGGN